jgi:hypothetical protein
MASSRITLVEMVSLASNRLHGSSSPSKAVNDWIEIAVSLVSFQKLYKAQNSFHESGWFLLTTSPYILLVSLAFRTCCSTLGEEGRSKVVERVGLDMNGVSNKVQLISLGASKVMLSLEEDIVLLFCFLSISTLRDRGRGGREGVGEDNGIERMEASEGRGRIVLLFVNGIAVSSRSSDKVPAQGSVSFDFSSFFFTSQEILFFT